MSALALSNKTVTEQAAAVIALTQDKRRKVQPVKVRETNALVLTAAAVAAWADVLDGVEA